MGIMIAIVSCGPPHKFDDYLGEGANKTRKYFSDRNVSSEHAQDFWQDTKDYAGERANVTRDYFYDRGLCNMRHGRHCGDTSRPSDGNNGSNGDSGNDGTNGNSGADGNNGNNGTSGSDGTNGTSGSNGVPGPTGAAGADGLDGAQGASGQDGAQGSQGVQGTQGVAGTAGQDGSQGVQGVQGVQGNAGTNGTQGIQGIAGVNGAAGIQGPVGPPGADGSNSLALGPDPVYLGLAYSFTVFSKAGITNVPGSIIVGDIGTSPITGASIVALDCIEVTGHIYTVDAAGPACRTTNPLYLTLVVSDMETAYTDAAGRTLPDETELGAGEIGGLTIVPGLYKWGTDVLISTDVTLEGGPNDVWIFQVAGNLLQASATQVNLVGGAQAKNIFWQVAGSATIFTSAHFEGTILSQTLVSMLTGATMNGRLLAQTEVTLQSNVIAHP